MPQIIYLILILLGMSASPAISAILVLSPDGSFTTKSTLASAATDPDVAGKTVIVTSALTADQSNISTATLHAWPSDRVLKVEKGGTIANTTKFVINGTFIAGLYQTFAGSAPVSFGAGSVAEVSPEWWGAKADGLDSSANVNTAAIHAAVATRKPVRFASGEYIHNGITIEDSTAANMDGVTLLGSGWLNTTLTCKRTGIDNIRFNSTNSYFQYLTIHDLSIKGNGSNGCGIYGNGIVWWNFQRLHIHDNGSHGIFIGGDSAGVEGGSYIGIIRDCRIYSNAGDGIHQVATGEKNQQNASYIQNCELAYNTNGLNLWGTNIVASENIIEANRKYGVLLKRVEGATGYSAFNVSITNSYFEKNPFGHILSYSAVSGSYIGVIVSLKITDNFFSSVGTGGVNDIPVKIDGTAQEMGVYNLIYEDNVSSRDYKNELVINCGIGPASSVKIVSRHQLSATTYSEIAKDASRVIVSNTGTVNYGFKTKTLQGFFYAKGGAGIVYPSPGALTSNVVSGSTTYFPIDVPVGSFIRKFAVPVSTDAKSYYLTFTLYSKDLASAVNSTKYTELYAPPSANSGGRLSGNSLAETYSIAHTKTYPMVVLDNANLYYKITVTIDAPGTYFYLSDPFILYY